MLDLATIRELDGIDEEPEIKIEVPHKHFNLLPWELVDPESCVSGGERVNNIERWRIHTWIEGTCVEWNLPLHLNFVINVLRDWAKKDLADQLRSLERRRKELLGGG